MTNRNRVKQILKLLLSEYPDAGTMLEFSSNFELLVAVILSAQSTDMQVNRVTAELFKRNQSPQDFAALSLIEIEDLIKGVGLHKTKAKNIKAMAELLIKEHGGQIPADLDELIKLPGVGRKTANVMLAVGFNQPGLGVDTHVHRVANRLGLAASKNPDKTEKELKALIPRELWSKSHHLFIWHGRKVCKARKPRCEECVLEELCPKNCD
ncbi:endonuclease iii [hydrocarbon metagenome]|uniref:Endonuclease iii n=1 Tax=hydrocarbon metagenome TaxID=938273 RepID=A0A0W8E2P8_9ZZZZ